MGNVSDINVAESVSVAESIAVYLDQLHISVAESITAAESTLVYQINVSVAEGVSAAESITISLDQLNLSVTEAVSVAASTELTPNTASDLLISTLDKISGSLADGGWNARGQVIDDADELDFYKEIEITVDVYAGGWEATPRPAFIGYVVPDPWEKFFQTSRADFSAFTAQEFMKRGRIQGIFFKDVASSPDNWHQIVDMTYADIVEHIVGKSGEYGHSNLVAGVWPEGILTLDIDSTNSSLVGEYDLKEGNFWQRLVEIANIDFYIIYVDKAAVLHYVPHPMFGASLPDPVLTLTSDLLLEPLTIERRNDEQIGQVIISGHTPSGLQIRGKYPSQPAPGPIVEKGGYIADDNSLMGDIAERMYKFNNRDFTVTARVGNGLGLLLDIMDRVEITYGSLVDGISWSEKKFWVHGIEVTPGENFTAETTLTLEAENA